MRLPPGEGDPSLISGLFSQTPFAMSFQIEVRGSNQPPLNQEGLTFADRSDVDTEK